MGRLDLAISQLLLLALTIRTGEAVSCYQCTTINDAKCNDPFDTSELRPTECTLQSVHQMGIKIGNALENLGSKIGLDLPSGGGNPDVHWSCMKMDYTTSNGDKHVIRGCHPPKTDSYDPCTLKNSNDKQSFCGACENDGCNGGVRPGSVSALVYLLLPCLIALKAVAA